MMAGGGSVRRQYAEDPCPDRGVGLSHVREATRFGYRCMHCQTLLYAFDRNYHDKDAVDDPEEPVPFNVQKMIDGLRATIKPAPGDVWPTEHMVLPEGPSADGSNAHGVVEGKWITGTGPVGDKDGQGRWGPYGHQRERYERLRESWLNGGRD